MDEKRKRIEELEQDLQRHKKKKRLRWIITGIIIFLLLMLIGAYLWVAIFFRSHFFLNTEINGMDVSLHNAKMVENYFKEQISEYRLKLIEIDGRREFIDGDDIDLEYECENEVENLLKEQNVLLWGMSLLNGQKIEASVGVSYDAEKLREAVENLNCLKEERRIPSVSACPEYVDGKMVVKEEVIGTEIKEKALFRVVRDAVDRFVSEVNLKDNNCYVLPEYTKKSKKLIAAVEEMNEFLKAEITLDFSPNTEVVNSDVISNWIDADEKMEVVFHEEKVKEYVAGLAEKYDTYKKTRNFVTATGKTVQVAPGSFGWQIDQETECANLIEEVKNQTVVTREVSYLRRGISHEEKDFGNTYAEVDLTNQNAYYFQNGQCVLQTPVVTGNPKQNNGTPQGVYSLAYKAPNQVLRGKKLPDGKYEYESPVSYWMPFNGGIGFHDAPWRSQFGGKIYDGGGSHGCINMPVDAAKKLYEMIQPGIPVICHY